VKICHDYSESALIAFAPKGPQENIFLIQIKGCAPMIRKKVCMLGSFAVGKTSLVQRFVSSRFPRKYQTTIGVMIDKKTVEIGDQEVYLMLWDIYGQDEFRRVQTSYLADASGYFLVVDGTRKDTLDTALGLCKRVNEEIGDIPFVLVLNKTDLKNEWEVNLQVLDELSKRGWTVVETSAKTGEGVEKAFLSLTAKMLQAQTLG
jgi:small GTP-binding protein